MSSADRCDEILRLIDQTLEEYGSLKQPRAIPVRGEPPLPLCEASPRRLMPSSVYKPNLRRDRTRR